LSKTDQILSQIVPTQLKAANGKSTSMGRTREKLPFSKALE
jgi:hypothetical protein